MRRVRARKVNSANGETHFIIEETHGSEHSERFKDYAVFEIKKISGKEAAKPLVLLREE